MTTEQLNIIYGNAVSGNQRFNRDALQQKLMRTLQDSVGIKMFGLRRIGKSTMRLYAVEQLQEQNRTVIFVDAQGLHSLEDLIGAIYTALPEQNDLRGFILKNLSKDSPVKNFLEALMRGSNSGENVITAYSREMYNAIRNGLREIDDKPVLVIDEFSLLLQNMLNQSDENNAPKIDQLLAAMREWREAGMKMLLTGSIGVTALSRKHGLSTDHLNDLLPFDVPELSEQEAREFIRQATAQSSHNRWTDCHTSEFIKQSGVLYPSFLVKGLLEIDRQNPPDPAEFANIFATNVRPILHNDFYNQFNKRFKLYAEIDQAIQQRLITPALSAIMQAESATDLVECKLADEFNQIDLFNALDMLVEDGFVHFIEDENGLREWKPASRLARLWWNRTGLKQ